MVVSQNQTFFLYKVSILDVSSQAQKTKPNLKPTSDRTHPALRSKNKPQPVISGNGVQETWDVGNGVHKTGCGKRGAGPKPLGVEPRWLRGRLHGVTLSEVEVTPHSTMASLRTSMPFCQASRPHHPPSSSLHDPGQPDVPTATLKPLCHPVFKAASKAPSTAPTCTESHRPSTEVPIGRLHTLEEKHCPLIWHRRVPGWCVSVWTGHARLRQRQEPSASCSGGPDKLWASVPAWAA